jgi:penicillin amidase
VPIRAGGDGTLPVPGWNDDYIWTGFIPYEEAPRVFNPVQGYIVTANNPQVRAEDYPYLLSKSHFRGQRAARITALIEADDEITLEDMIAIQTDNVSLSGLEIVPYLDGLRFDDPAVTAARDRLLDWDADMRMDSPEAALFNLFWVHLLEQTYHDQLPERQYPSGNHITADAMYFLLSEPNASWWDDAFTPGQTEDRDDILIRAFTSAYADGVERFGSNMDNWRWGELHTITFRNATLGRSGIGLIENIFNRGPYTTNGSESVVQKTCWNANDPYQVTCIPALRRVIDLGDLSQSQTIHSVGQSGHPYSRHYDDFIDAWRTFEYHPSNWERLQAESGAHETLILEP